MNHHVQIMDDGADHAVRTVPDDAVRGGAVHAAPENPVPGDAVPDDVAPDGVVHAAPEEAVDQTDQVRRLMPTERT